MIRRFAFVLTIAMTEEKHVRIRKYSVTGPRVALVVRSTQIGTMRFILRTKLFYNSRWPSHYFRLFTGVLCCIVQETLKLMGVPGTVQWAAWLGEYITIMLVVLSIMTVLFCLPVTIDKVEFESNDNIQTTGYVFESRGVVDVSV